MSAPQTRLVLKWAWSHLSLYVEEFSSLDHALRAADGADESLLGIEVWDEEGYRYLEWWEVDKLLEARGREAEPLIGAAVITPPPGTEGLGGHGEASPVPLRNYTSIEEWDADVARLRAVLGDRVKAQRVGLYDAAVEDES